MDSVHHLKVPCVPPSYHGAGNELAEASLNFKKKKFNLKVPEEDDDGLRNHAVPDPVLWSYQLVVAWKARSACVRVCVCVCVCALERRQGGGQGCVWGEGV